MDKTPTPRQPRIPAAVILLLLAALACSLPGAGTPDSSAPESLTNLSVIIQSPMPGAHVTVGQSFDFLATAADSAGVARLDLFIDNVAVLSQSSPDANGLPALSLMYPLVATNSGTYALIVRAYNNKGEMRDSAIHYVTVAGANASTQGYAQYVVQEGDTLESIAQRLGISVDSILQANPNLQNGQLVPGQVILIPIGVQPPPQAALPAPGGGAQPIGQPINPPGQPGNPPNNPPTVPPTVQPVNPPNNPPAVTPVVPPTVAPTVTPTASPNNPPINPPLIPGIVPIFLPFPVQLPSLPPGVIPIGPGLFPVVPIINLPGGAAPGDLQAAVNGCQITLTWKDNASDETNYRILRADPGQAKPALIATLQPDTTQFQDNLPGAGKYEYLVEYYKKLSPAQNDSLVSSAPLWVETQASPTCPNGPKRVFFQPILFQPTDSGLGFGFINVTIGSYTAFRVPRGQQVNHPTGTYTTDDRWAIPLPELQTMQPGESLRVEIQGNATKAADNTIVFVLGQEAASHSYETLTSADAKNTTWKIFTPYMTVGYKIWMEDWQWGGAISNPQMPAPTNLKLGSYVNAHELTWDYDPDAKNKFAVDGFIVYPKYSCGNSSQPTQPPLVASAQKLSVATKTMPAGCICSYQVSAFGASGESALSASTTEACQTPAAEESVLVTFESVKVNSLAQPTSASITLSANGRVITSPNLLLEAGNINSLKNVAFTGASTANQVTLNFAAGESRAIQLGFSAANLCIGQALVGKDMKTWSGAPASYIMTSTDGNCTVIVSINGTSVPGAPPVLPPANLPPVNPPNNPPNNPPVNPPNNPPVNPPAGNGTTRFINNTSHPIVSLVIDSQDVIQTQAQIILQGSWLDVSGVTANNHTLEAANGFMDASGSLQLLLRLPAETFAGAPGSFTINDPGIEQLLTGAFIGEYWDANTIIHSAGFCFHANGSFDFFDDGKFQSSGSYSLISRNPGAYSVKFNVKDSQGEQFAGDYSYAGPQMGLMLIHNGPPSWPMIEYIRDTQCPAKP